MQNADVVLDNLGAHDPVSCGEFEQQGLNGQLDMAFCDAFPLFVQVPCVCQPISPTPPSPAPITTTTSIPTSDGNTPIPPPPPFPSCNVCGDGMEVTLPDVIIVFGPSGLLSCADLYSAGIAGILPPDICSLLLGAIPEPCGCEQISQPGAALSSPVF